MMRRFYFLGTIIIAILILISGCNRGGEGKIKLAAETTPSEDNAFRTASTILRVAPEQQRKVAIFYFANDTHKKNLEWLRRGITDLFITELSQSPYLSVVPINRLNDIARTRETTIENLADLTSAIWVARQAEADILLHGRYFFQQSNLCIEVEIIEAKSERLLHHEKVSGEGLERVFTMVDSLSENVRHQLRGKMEKQMSGGVNLSAMTTSLEAFRCYSEAMENLDKFLQEEAEKCLEDAIRADSTFALAYLRLAEIKYHFGKKQDALHNLHRARELSDRLSETDKISLKIFEQSLEGKYQDILQTMKDAVSRYPYDVELRLQYARLLRSMGFLDHSLEEFEIVLEMDSGRKLIYNDLGYLFAERGEFTTALKYFDKYQSMAADEPNPYDSKGEILMKAGRLPEAADQLKTALDKWPKFSYSAQRLARLYTELADMNQAMHYMKIMEENTTSYKMAKSFVLDRARIYWRFGEENRALSILKPHIQKDLACPQCIRLAGEIYNSLGDTAAAQKIYRQTLANLQKRMEAKPDSFAILSNFLGIMLESGIPASELIPLFQSVDTQKMDNLEKAIALDLVRGILYLRAGYSDRGAQYLQNREQDFINNIITLRYQSWSTLWKYIFDMMDYFQEPKNGHMPFVENFLQHAKKVERKDLEAVARLLRSRLYHNADQAKQLQEEYQIMGVPQENAWTVIGPFSARSVSGFTYAYPPEHSVDLNAVYSEGKRRITWKPASDSSVDGYVDLKENFGQSSWVVGYGLVYIRVPEKRKVQIRFGSDEACKIWLNNDLIWQLYEDRYAVIDKDIVTVVLHPGNNKLLVKVSNWDFDWGFYFRITDEKGDGIPEVSFHTAEEVHNSLAVK
ncbi:MAG: hypothetical protein Kow0042_05160 [Calditrichia bacterium]